MEKIKLIITVLALFCGISFNSANAVVITFDGLAGTSMPGSAGDSYPGLYTHFNSGVAATVDGFYFSSQSTFIYNPSWGISDMTNMAWNGTDYMTGVNGINISQVGGGAFTLNSFDLANRQDGNTLDQVTLIGNFVGGGSFSQILGLNTTPNQVMQGGNDFTTYNLNGFNNISSANIFFHNSAENFYEVALDNINVVSAVPEPETYTMLLAGLSLFGFSAHRRKDRNV